MKTKGMKIFLSHSAKDKEVALLFKEMFEDFGQKYDPTTEVFMSSEISSDQVKTGNWKKDFEENLKKSSKLVVLVTPNSLHSVWVTYEIGYAIARGIEITPVVIRGATPEKFLLNERSAQKMEREEDVIKLLSLIFKDIARTGPARDGLIRPWCDNHKKKVKEMLVSCEERCVYFVGSKPSSEPDKNKWNQHFVDRFLSELTYSLLEKGYKVSSFPAVDDVGKIVWMTAMKDKKNLKMYEISGLYGFDEVPTDKDGKPFKIDKSTWKETLDGFRKLYLANKSSMIIMGGNDHTKDEYEVATQIDNLEIFPIPCMGGTGEEIFHEKERDIIWTKQFDHPCLNCKGDIDECKRIEQFVERLSKYNYIDADERKS